MLCKPFKQDSPTITAACYIAENATLIGKIILGSKTSLWYGTVLRADDNQIQIGECSNIQDNCVLHCDADAPTLVGNNVTVGHASILHGCTIEDGCTIGMGSILMNHCVVGAGSIVAAGSLVTQNTIIPPGSLVMGSPAKVKRSVTPEELAEILASARHYHQIASASLPEEKAVP